MASYFFDVIKQCARKIVNMCEEFINFIYRFFKNLFVSNKLSFIDRVIRAVVFVEVESELTRHLYCEYERRKISELNCDYLFLQPRETTENTKHIVLFKSHGTSIYSFVQGFRLDFLANCFNITWYVIDYKKECYDMNIKVENRLSTHCLDHFVACVDALISRINMEGNKPSLVGFSLGCAMLLEYASRTGKRFFFFKIILFSPFLSLREYLHRNRLLLWFVGKRINKNFSFNNRVNITKIPENPEQNGEPREFSDKRDDILILHGKQDNVIPIRHAEELARVGRCRLVTIPWCKHVDIVNDSRTWKKTMEFLNKN